ncbi:hypothetical protein H1P_60056 [Hyella patelloides LEGE 07179]|uniref:Uncharacterized protein n=2 Tax=Hyella TaxID=945733 RepID=A0A563W162_9CYAN|nr:hypothetical protein H1P_60056 [Hyella patelloides LEGE 07179]
MQQLLVTTQIKLNLQTKDKIAIAKKIFQFQHQETIQSRSYLPKAFLTEQEKVWLKGEIERSSK